MKNTLKALSLALLLAAPFALPASAQTASDLTVQVWQPIRCEGRISQDDRRQQEWAAYGNSKYTYWDAKVLATFWGDGDVSEAKALIGRKLLWGSTGKALLEQYMVDARFKALNNAENLNLYFDTGLSYDDVEALAEFWGESDTYQAKIRVERNFILGNEYVVREAVRLAKQKK